MKPLPQMTDAERAYCNEMRMLSVDGTEQEVFVGLNREESEWYHRYSGQVLLSDEERDPELEQQGDRYLELNDRHQVARLAILNAENEAKHTPVRH